MISTIPQQNSDTCRSNGKNRTRTVYRLCGLTAGLGIWQLTAMLIAQPLIVPKLEAIAAAVGNIFTGEDFFVTVAATLLRIAATIAIDTVIAFLLGIAAGVSERIEAALSPFETAMRAVPTMGVLLLSLIWFNSEITPIFVASLIALPLLYRGVVNGVKNIDISLIQMSTGFRVSFIRKLTQLYIPSIRPFTLTAYSATLGLLVKVMVTAEVLSQPRRGIGTEFQIARAQLDTATIFGWGIIVIIFAALMEQAAQHILSYNKVRKTTHATDTAKHTDETEEGATLSALISQPIPHTDEGYLITDTDTTFRDEPVNAGEYSDTDIYAVSDKQAAEIHIDRISFNFESVPVFQSFSLEVKPARINYILGRSGRGKTTLLFLIAGFLNPQRGTIRISPPDAKIGFAYQDLRLIPHLTAEENIRYVLPPDYGTKKTKHIARRYLQMFGLQGFEHFKPAELSGGMQRRVSLARALAYPSEILLLDEAFDSLDPETKKAAAKVFSRIVQQQRRTVLCVTHDPIFTQLIEGVTLDVPSSP